MSSDLDSVLDESMIGKLDIAMTKPVVITSWSQELADTFKDAKVIGLGIQGVDLGRMGAISLIQLTKAGSGRVYLLDVYGMETADDNELIKWMRGLLESESIVKVMHDCRMGSDALEHLLKITLVGVHDVACWHEVLHGTSDAPIKTVCSMYGLQADAGPSGQDYLANYKLWGARPLTAKLVGWGAKDAGNVLEIYNKQVAAASAKQVEQAREKVVLALDVLRGAQMEVVSVGARKLGAFIGRGASALRGLQQSSGTRIYPRGLRSEGNFCVFYRDAAGLDTVKRKVAAM